MRLLPGSREPQRGPQHATRWVICLAIVLGQCALAAAQTAGPSEYQVKAAFLYNFAKFVEWPHDIVSDDDRPFKICIVGEKSVERELEQIVAGKSLDRHRVEVSQVHRVQEGRLCQILFIGASAGTDATRYLEALREVAVLTVGETQGFCEQGGVLNFWTQDQHVRFEINPQAAERARLHASSKLQRLAKVCAEPPRPEGGN